ncbi:MAG: copper homeostasis protein CutC [Prevotella sp.]
MNNPDITESTPSLRFEICANGVESCLAAQEGGADRVELCAGIPEGGTTPSYGEIKTARRLLTSTRLHVIIRPRGGHFVYSGLELERMAEDIRMARELGADGVVFGCLTPQGDIDHAANRQLMECAEGLSTTFHRAFDHCRQPEQAMEELIGLGFDRILTSGQQPTAYDGTALLRRLEEQAANRIIIMAGCGVNENNIAQIRKATGVCEYHFSAREKVSVPAYYINQAVFMGAPDADEQTIMLTTSRRVKATIAACQELSVRYRP